MIIPIAGRYSHLVLRKRLRELETMDINEITNKMIIMRIIQRFQTGLNDKNDHQVLNIQKIDVILIGIITKHIEECDDLECPCHTVRPKKQE